MINKIVIRIENASNLLGLSPSKFIRFFRGLPFYFKTHNALKKQMLLNDDFVFGICYPILDERCSEGGTIKGHYFHQDLLIARKIFENKPKRHVDIGSRIDGFVAHVASFREIEIFDIRPVQSSTRNIIFRQADLMKLPDEMVACCDSLSSLHAIEHFGLGRYGDPIDINGHIKAIENMHSMLKKEGKFYFSVPIGRQRIEFNAHRVFSIEYLLKILDGKFIVDGFNYVDDNGDLHENATLSQDVIKANYSCNYGCGIFELTKIG